MAAAPKSVETELAEAFPNAPALDDKATRLLREVVAGGVIRGSAALQRSHLDRQDFLDAAKKLADAGFVNAHGNLNDSVDILYAMFSPNPQFLPVFERVLRLNKAV